MVAHGETTARRRENNNNYYCDCFEQIRALKLLRNRILLQRSLAISQRHPARPPDERRDCSGCYNIITRR